MSNGFERFQQVLSTKQAEFNTQTRQQQEREKENQRREEQLKRDHERVANENQQAFEDAGVIKLFQEIIDSKAVVCSLDDPLMSDGYHKDTIFGNRKYVKPKQILPYKPAKIVWSSHSRTINDMESNTMVSLFFNEKPTTDSNYDSYYDYDIVSLYLTEKRKVGIMDEKGKILEIEPGEIPEYIATQIAAKTLR